LPKGLIVTNLGISGPFQVRVIGVAPAGYMQISADGFQDNGIYANKYEHPRGVAVNKNPASPSFGRVYVSVARIGTTAGSFVRTTFDGIYLLNSDNTVALNTGVFPRTAGLPFFINVTTTNNAETSSPMRINVGRDDDRLYICDFSDARGGLWVTDTDVATNSIATNVLFGIGGPTGATNMHGSTTGVAVEGSLGSGNLKVFTLDEDLSPLRSVWRYDVGSGPLASSNNPVGPLSTMPIANLTLDLAKGGAGTNVLYMSQNRSAGTDGPSVRVFTDDGVAIGDSLTESRTYLNDPGAADLLRNTLALDLSADGKTLALLRGAAFGRVWLVPLLPNGLFDFANTNSFALPNASENNRDLAFDAAGNIYVVSSASEYLRIYARGGTTIAVTSSDGTFAMPALPTVSVTATTPNASETGPNAGAFTLTRSSTAGPLTVNLTLTGTATNGVDYATVPTAVTFVNGQATTNLTILPMDDSVSELAETVTLTVSAAFSYSPGTPASAVVTIADNDPNQLRLTSMSTNVYERLTYDQARVTFQRLGDVNTTISIDFTNIVCSGIASSNVDYYLTNLPITLDPGVVSSNVLLVYPLDDIALEGSESITLGSAPGVEFSAATNIVSSTITDDDQPAESVLFSDDFSFADTATNWVVYYASTNPPEDDKTVTFAFDYTGQGIPPAPHSNADTLGLFIQVNKNDATATAAAVNLYPLNKSFSGDYALRFDMYLIVGAGSLTTEYALMGINHSGTKTNWFRNSGTFVPAGWQFDGLFYGVESDAAALGDYVLYSSPQVSGNPTALTPGRNAETLTQVFKSPPYFSGGTAAGGAPANVDFSPNPAWADVEISQIGNQVTLKINNTEIFGYTNTTNATSGNIMIGYVDAFDSLGPPLSGVIYDNVRVIDISAPRITQIQLINAGTQVQVDFSGRASDSPSAYKLQEKSPITGTFADTSDAPTSLGSGNFRVVTSASGSEHYYRIRRNP
jgi:hypothetical protein